MQLQPKLATLKATEISWPAAWLSALSVAAFTLGGSARGDELSLLVYRPFSALVCVACLCCITKENVRNAGFFFWWILSIVALTIIHLIPLPVMIWNQLPGRQVIVDLDRTLNLGDLWRPLTLSPELTRNALWSLLGPLAAFVLTMQIPRKAIINVFYLIGILALVSGGVSVMQIAQGAESPLYLYRITNLGVGVGLFANRNHQALMLACLVPIGWALSQYQFETWRSGNRKYIEIIYLAGLCAIILFSALLVVITGSRAGIGLFFLTVVVTLFVISPSATKGSIKDVGKTDQANRSTAAWRGKAVFGGVLLTPLIAIGLASFAGRDVAIQRFSDRQLTQESRVEILGTLIEVADKYFPFGSGVGTFDPVFRIHEPDALLGPTYWNHAHNDWIEVAITSGLPGAMIIIIGMIAFAKNCRQIFATSPRDICDQLARVSVIIIVITALSSLVDYPLRVPSLGILVSICLGTIVRSVKRV